MYHAHSHIQELVQTLAAQGDRVSSEKKRNANRRNSLKSTGPKTPLGKRKSMLNAAKHGICSMAAVLPGEDASAYRKLEKCYFDHWSPVGPNENRLVHQMVTEDWKIGRIARAEIALHVRVRDAAISRLLQSLSKNALALVKSKYSSELKDHVSIGDRHDKIATTRIIVTGGSRPDKVIDRGPAIEPHDSELTEFDSRLRRILEVENTVLDAWVPRSEVSPQAFLDRERRTAMRMISKYAEELYELQEVRRTITLVRRPSSPPPDVD